MRTLTIGAGAMAVALAIGGTAGAATLQAALHQVTEQGVGESVGTVTIADGPNGAVFTPALQNLPPGEHGFHVHENGECGPGPDPQGRVIPGGAAGGHWDPDGTGHHAGPQGAGHLGDLPVLAVAADGTARTPVTAPRIDDASRVAGLTLMVHAGGDTYSDQPPSGGGGARIACGVIEPRG
jgi:Cu-Zn family superoxide dismutase